MSNFYLICKRNNFFGHQLQVNIELKKKIMELTLNFSLRYFCFSVNYLTLTELKNCLKILCELTLNEDNISHLLAQH